LEPIIIHKTDQERIQVTLDKYRGKLVVGIRTYYRPLESKEWIPTKKGITISTRYFKDVMDALRKIEKEIEKRSSQIVNEKRYKGRKTKEDS
jgi:hypothetical protein